MPAAAAASLASRMAFAAIASASGAGLWAAASLAQPVHAEESTTSPHKLSIYPEPADPVTLVPYQTELERQVGQVRRSIKNATADSQDALRGVVNKWVNTERRVEAKVKSLVPKDEPITPGILYVGVATLAGSVFGRYRSLPIRLLAPPTFLVVSLNYFLPKFSHNLSQYYIELEKQHLPPAVGESRESFLQKFRDAAKSSSESLQDATRKAESGIKQGLLQVEQTTGLKVASSSGAAAPTPNKAGEGKLV